MHDYIAQTSTPFWRCFGGVECVPHNLNAFSAQQNSIPKYIYPALQYLFFNRKIRRVPSCKNPHIDCYFPQPTIPLNSRTLVLLPFFHTCASRHTIKRTSTLRRRRRRRLQSLQRGRQRKRLRTSRRALALTAKKQLLLNYHRCANRGPPVVPFLTPVSQSVSIIHFM